MRVGLVFSMMVVALSLPVAGLADDFGSRFLAQAPAALGEYTASDDVLIAQDDDIAQELQDIAPAAGEEEPVSEVAPEAVK